MAAVWQVQEAKSRLSELIDKAAVDGPQTITRHGRPVAQLVAYGDAAVPEADDGFLDFLLACPKSGLDEGLPAMPRRSRQRSPFEA